MFDLEGALAKWREQFGGSDAELLDELESHLRDDVDMLLRTGLNEQQAFETAVARIGGVQRLKNEFNAEQKIKSAILLAAIGAYVLATIVPVLFKLGSFADVTSAQQRWALAAVVVTVIGFFAGRFFGRILPATSRHVLLIMTAVVVFFQLLWLVMFFYHVMHHAEWDMSQLTVAVLWGMSPIPLFSILLGMEEAAAGRVPKTHA